MTKGRGLLIAAAFAVTAMVPLPALAAPAPPPQESKVSVNRIFDELHLTPEQRVACIGIVRDGFQVNSDLRRLARTKWHELLVTLRKPGVTLDEALAKQRELAEFQEKLAEKRLATWFAVRQLLTPEQLARLSSLRLDGSLLLEVDHGELRNSNAGHNDIP